MITRRTLLLGTAAVASSRVLTSCSQQATERLTVTLLEGAVPAEVLKQFRKQVQLPVSFRADAQMQWIFQRLQRWQRQPPEKKKSWQRFFPWYQPEDLTLSGQLMSLGDFWLQDAIAQDLLAPMELPPETLEALPFQWQQFVSRNAEGQTAPAGTPGREIWAVPYKVQSLMIVYRQSQFADLQNNSQVTAGQPVFTTWQDLLAPRLRRRIALPSHPNLVIGLLQKMQSGSFNTGFNSLASRSAAKSQLLSQLAAQLREPFLALNQQVKTYDAADGLRALVNEDVDVALAWSGDVATALQRYRDLKAVVPEEGSLLSADLWVRPKGTPMSEAAKRWIEFCWEAGPATQISISGRGISPIFLGEGVARPDVLNNHLLPVAAMDNSEPLLPLPENLQAAYLDLWEQLRTESVAVAE
ncbi:MAG: extracellular solute-binding protein [Cyanobacteria bacterium J06627_28]